MEQQRDIIASTAVFFSKLCQGKAMVTYTKPQKMKKEESKRLRVEKDQIKYLDLLYER